MDSAHKSRTMSRARRFQNEALLQQAVASLLARIPGITDVQILQGTQEYGKDVVFRTSGPLGEVLHCACVVKNNRLTGKVGTRGSLRAVFDQIEQALDTPFIDAYGEDRRVHHVYVISPEDITQNALASVQAKLGLRSGQVIFKCGASLFEMFKRFWPEFLAEESAVLAAYASRLEEAGRSATALSLLAVEYALGPVPEVTRQIYVEPSFKREVRHYALDWGVDWLFDNHWPKTRAPHLERVFLHVIEFLSHCDTWPLPGWAHSDQLGTVREIVDRCIATLRKHAAAAARNPTKASVLDKSERTELAGHFESLSPELRDLRDVAADALRKHSRLLERYSPSRNPLSDPVFQNLCLVDDCLRAYPGPAIKTLGHKTIALGKNLHRQYDGTLVIEGGPGTGKTSFCRWHALSDASALVANEASTLPIYVPLHELSSSRAGTFEELFLSRIGRSVLIPDHIASRSGIRRRMYLDGLDEVADPDKRATLIQIIRDETTRKPHCQVVFTVRDYVREKSLAWAPRVTLSGLDDQEIMQLALLWLDGDREAAAAFGRQIESSPVLMGVARVPLLTTVMILVFKQTGRVPENRARLYSVFVGLLCGGWDLAKGIVRPSQFSVEFKLRLLMTVGSKLHASRMREFDESWFARAARALINSPAPVLNELVSDGIISRTGNMFEFSHLSFQEYFAAREMLGDPSGRERHRVLVRYLDGDLWWREVLMFYIGLSQNPEALVKWINGAMDRTSRASDQGKTLIESLSAEFAGFDLESAMAHPEDDIQRYSSR